ncbi:MAG: 2,3,4,5-tetrahydropyridine-2,6-dicarboxylate N-succinyltransferase [Actinobacteria bacterium]|jgi:2,3,4,5-tetrahydropyridine-2,6-dicarboxylate N-succinyltransferase|nr:2,3,4,5-tetrahydropyridine-2,6-dicarboxylate N-succinyltransferase [Actinomycetota bacterium]
MSSSQSMAYGVGVATQTESGQTLDCHFHSLGLGSKPANKQGETLNLQQDSDLIRKVKKIAVDISIDLSVAPKDVADVYLRLHLLSHRLVKPHSINLDNIFTLLPNVVWTSVGACEINSFDQVRLALQNKYGNLTVYSVDKFPRMIDYVIPEGVRIADGDRVRLGAYLSAGTTVMHEGFVNFNAGTLGKSMVEGRISSGVVVGDGSDIGGGASIMGTLSGGGKEVISIGERTLLGANSGAGISLGNDCVIEAGVYITAGSKILLPDGKIVKAKELSGANNLLFRRNSQSGSLEVVPKSGSWSGLNSVLHNN